MNEFLKSPEAKKSEPEVKFFFSAHGTPEDYRGIEQAFSEADIYVLESHAWKDGDLEELRSIASGDTVPTHISEGREPKDAIEYEEELLYKSGKRVEIVDVPMEHELANEDDGSSKYNDIVDRFVAQGDLNSSVESLQDTARQNADYIKKKDDYVEKELKKLIDQIADESPEAKILVQMGSSHSGISHKLRKEGVAKRVMNEVRYDFNDELLRTFRFNKEPNTELISRSLIEQTIKRFFFDEMIKVPYLLRNKFFRDTLSDISTEQVQQMGQIMESRYFDEMIMGGGDDTPETNRVIFVYAWEAVIGSDINLLISQLEMQVSNDDKKEDDV
ncbi:hypothetical protein HN358_01305 [Candidatus Uhrbacteria bacterium]|jgi:hypothetical protein|nr:hypothetical protein [Candidatus Uhrbacteria bacterium]MBT7717331.1 hypothetical protein [Candidatus Uhrbacteria bacterium]